MKSAIATAALLLFVAATVPIYARQEKGQEDHSQASHSQADRPAQSQAKPQRKSRPATQQQARAAQPAQQQHSQQAAHTDRSQAHAVNRSPQRDGGNNQARVQPRHAGIANHGNAHGRISDANYTSHFGSEHNFHVNRADYDRRRFQYGGYSFGFIDPWPVGWGYSDDVYVVYSDGGYYMYDRVHPGLRIAVSIL